MTTRTFPVGIHCPRPDHPELREVPGLREDILARIHYLSPEAEPAYCPRCETWWDLRDLREPDHPDA